eukprot:jgi/Galph1/5270/GphlegSOOS_G3969.1
MTSLEKLGISGIRSFEPREEVVIRFRKPLTIILGHNGAGKTTIIECIKMACTGDLPPFVDKGSAFIHDPRINSDTETKGKIRLQFTDLAGRKIVVNRQFQLLNKATTKKQEFKSVEQSVQILTEANEKLTLSQRHADVNKTVPELMGVTKAILEHVVFVHQEESNWPLSDSKHLKEKFDEIFAATRYTKALEAIRKYRREKTMKLKEMVAELALWQEKVNQAKKIQDEYNSALEQKEKVDDSINTLKKELSQEETQWNDIRNKLNEMNNINEQIRSLEAVKQSHVNALKDAYASMDEEYVEADDELREFEEKIQQKIEALEETRGQRESDAALYRTKLDEYIEHRSTLLTEKGHWETAHALYNQKLSELDVLKRNIRETLVEKYACEPNETSMEEYLEQCIHTWEQERTQKIDQISQKEAQISKKVDEKEEAMKEFRVNESIYNRSLEHMRQSVEKLEALDSPYEEQFSETELQNKLEQARKELQVKEQSLRDKQDESKRNMLKLKKMDLEKYADELRKRFSELFEERKKAYGDSQTANRYDFLKSQRDNLKNRITEVDMELKEFLSHVSEWDRDLEQHKVFEKPDLFSKLLKDIENEQREKLSLHAKTESDIESIGREIDAVNEKIRETQQKMHEMKEEIVTKTLLVHLSKQKRNYESGAEEFWKALLNRAEKKGCCPTCDRTFPTVDEFSSFVQKLQARAEKIHQGNLHPNISQATKEAEERVEYFRKRLPVWNELSHALRTLERLLIAYRLNVVLRSIKSISEQPVQKTQEQEALKKRADDLKNEVASLDRKKDIVSRIVAQLERRKSLLNELCSCEQELDNMNSYPGHEDNDRRRIDLIDEDLAQCQTDLEECSRSITTVDKELSNLEADIQILQADVDKQQETFQQIQNSIEQYRHRLEEKQRFLDEIRQKEEEVIISHFLCKSLVLISHKLRKLAEPMERCSATIMELKKALNDYKEERQKLNDEYLSKMNWATENKRAIDALNTELQLLSEKGNKDTMQRIVQEEEECNREISKLKEELCKVEEASKKNSTKFYQLSATLRNIEANKNFRKTKATIEKMETEKKALESQLLQLQEGEDIARRATELEQSMNDLNARINRLVGNKEELIKRITQVKIELDRANTSKSSEIYKEKFIEMKTLELSLKDLDQYHKALDHSLMTYHSIKMKEINKIIRELWQATYRGNDIDYIEIVSDSELDQTGVKRSYNYRVLMHRGDASLDMRGRCSAGQKILASLVIRLALAESFCLECGILALDEPTTNLDKENIESLANALSDIIRARRVQENFQLILITHDENFIELLGSREVTDSYYLVERDERGHSRVRLQSLNVLD